MAKQFVLKRLIRVLLALVVLTLITAPVLLAQEEAAETVEIVAESVIMLGEDVSAESVIAGLDTTWLLIAAFLVFFMQAGFAMVEAGFVRSKNVVNILMKNVIDFAFGSIFFFLIGFAFMFGESGNGFIGLSNFAYSNPEGLGFLLFQTVFAATAATIVSGAVAERMKFIAYIVYSAVICAVVYPIIGHWSWGSLFGVSGWLESINLWGGGDPLYLIDFAGSTVVHGVGGAMALAGAIVLGPRIGKYNKDGSSNVIPGHSMPLAALGVFILWFGWFGFNPGSQAQIAHIGDAAAVSLIAVNTNLSAAAGALTAMIITWILFKKPDLSMTLNGALGGLVAITAPCASVIPAQALIIGVVGGVLIVVGVLALDKLKIDDPVGAITVHGINGVWGTIAAGIFATGAAGGFAFGTLEQIVVQIIGTFASTGAAFAAMFLVFTIIKFTIGIRVSKEEELRGLDIGEHGMEAYGDFQSFSTK